MDSKTTGIVAYLTWIGLVISFVAGEKDDEFAKFHQNQSLVITIASIAISLMCFIFGIIGAVVPILGVLLGLISGILGLAVFVFFIMGLINAINNEMKPLPLIGGIKIIK